MEKHQRTWSLAEKLEAVRVLKTEGVSKASRQTGVSSTTLYKWVSRFDQHGEQGLTQHQNRQKDLELERLRRENQAVQVLLNLCLCPTGFSDTYPYQPQVSSP